MAKKTDYKKLTMELSGMSKEDYKRAYTTYAARVRNFNAAAGTKVTPAKMFYYTNKYADRLSPLQQDILATPATRAHRGERTPRISATTSNIARANIYNAWEGAISKSATLTALWEKVNSGEITLAEFSKRAQEWSDARRERQEKGDPITGSD